MAHAEVASDSSLPQWRNTAWLIQAVGGGAAVAVDEGGEVGHVVVAGGAEVEAEQQWVEHVTRMYSVMLMRKAKSWFTGYNSNVAGHEYGRMRYNIYNGGGPKYAQWLRDVAS